MNKRPETKSNKQSIAVKHRSSGLTVVLILLTIGLLLNAIFSFQLWLRQGPGLEQLAGSIVRSVENLSQPIVIEPLSGKAYVPSAHLELPAADPSLGELRFSSMPPSEQAGIPEKIAIVSSKDLHAAENSLYDKAAMDDSQIKYTLKSPLPSLFSAIPKLQACARGIQIYFVAQPDQKTAFTKQLANGKTVYYYTEPDCLNQRLFDYTKLIDSY